MRSIFNDLLVFLCLVDLIVIINNLILAARILFPDNLALKSIAPWSDCFCHVAFTASVFLIIAITVERYNAVNSPYTYATRIIDFGYCQIIMYYISPVIIGAVVFNTPKILQIANFLPNFLIQNEEIYIKAGIMYQIFHPLTTTYIIPIIILACLNIKIVQISRCRLGVSNKLIPEVNLAKITITIVCAFILLNIPTMLLTVYELAVIPNVLDCLKRKCRYYISSKTWLMDSITRYMVTLNCFINFIIYCFVGSNFRRTLGHLIKRSDVDMT